MPTEEEVERSLDTLAKYVQSVGDEIQVAYSPHVLNATPNEEIGPLQLKGHYCTTSESRYFIAAHSSVPFMYVAYYYSLSENIANALEEDTSRELLQAADIDWEDDDIQQRAAQYIVNNADAEDAKQFRSYLKVVGTNPNYHFNLIDNDNGRFSAFSVETKIFPYEDGFSINEFFKSKQAVVAGGEKAAEVIFRTVSLSVDEEDLLNSALEFR